MKTVVKYVKNKYIITTTAFLVWLLFFDRNDVVSQVELTQKLNELNKEKQ